MQLGMTRGVELEFVLPQRTGPGSLVRTDENWSSPLSFVAQRFPPGLRFRLELMWAEVWVGG